MPTRPYEPHPPGGYRKPKLDGLFDAKTPPLKIKKVARVGPEVGYSKPKWRPKDER
jgi:hypothetical protein